MNTDATLRKDHRAASWPTRGPVDFYGNNGSTASLDDFIGRTELDIDVVELKTRSSVLVEYQRIP